ncbi:hypothetical protein M885DRAFT_111520 [Pelagophyceae sp. CCMP2097]|nr:hypothetical protein M885DRAFT_111520 [Pelagophyceae sp. CCMP2097]
MRRALAASSVESSDYTAVHEPALRGSAALGRRAEAEEAWLGASTELQTPGRAKKSVKQKAGTGFGAPVAAVQSDAAAALRKDGVVRLNNALTPETTALLRTHVLAARSTAYAAFEKDPNRADDLFGIEPERASRCDVLLSFDGTDANAPDGHVVREALVELLDHTAVGDCFAAACGDGAPLYELCALVTEPGAPRQTVHPDTPWRTQSPLFCAFVALQDVDYSLGPTLFIPGSHTGEKSRKFSNDAEELFKTSKPVVATLKAGDCVIFDSRTLHAGTANQLQGGSTRAIFNVSFRNAAVSGNMGYKGSLRPDYASRTGMDLDSVSKGLV